MSFTQVDRDLLQKARVTVLVPSSSSTPIDELQQGQSGLEQRTSIYFGMLLTQITRPMSYSFTD